MNFLLSLHPIPLLLVSVFFKEFHPLVPECLSPRLSELNVTLCASTSVQRREIFGVGNC